jgi:hypothetical protein
VKKLAVLVGVLALLSFGASAWADYMLTFDGQSQDLTYNSVNGLYGYNSGSSNITVTNGVPQDIAVTTQYISLGVTFYSGDMTTLKSYSWFPANTFQDDFGTTVTYLLGPTFGTANGQPNSKADTLTFWLDCNEGPTSPSLATDQTNYPSGYVPANNFLGFNKYFTTSPSASYWSGTAIKFNSVVYAMSFNLSRPGKNAGSSSNIDIYLFNTTAAGGTKLVAHTLDLVVHNGGNGTSEWVTFSSPQGSPAFDLVVIYSSSEDRFMLDNLSASSAPSVKLQSPVPLSPSDSPHIKTFANAPRNTTVAWKPVSNASGYRVDLELKGSAWPAGPTTSVTVSDPKATSYEFTALPADGSYRWQVTALSAPGDLTHIDSAPSGWLQFNYASAVKLSAPNPICPGKNAQFYNDPRLTTLAWGRVPFATGYTVEVQYKDQTGQWVADSTDFSAGAVEVTGEKNSSETFTAAFTPAAGATPAEPVSYQWRVTAKGDGQTIADSDPSPWMQFNYNN